MGCSLSPRTAQGCPLGPPAPGHTRALATPTPESAGRLGATRRRRGGARGDARRGPGGTPGWEIPKGSAAGQGGPADARLRGSKGKPLPCAPEPPIVPSAPTPAPGRTGRARKGPWHGRTCSSWNSASSSCHSRSLRSSGPDMVQGRRGTGSTAARCPARRHGPARPGPPGQLRPGWPRASARAPTRPATPGPGSVLGSPWGGRGR